jgi:hypothetical protein
MRPLTGITRKLRIWRTAHGPVWDSSPDRSRDRVLVAGWFSWPNASATAGDLLARDVACGWLEQAGRSYDVANAPAFGPGIDWQRADPASYTDVLFVCGPVHSATPILDLLSRFPSCRLIGLDVSMIEPVENWNPFHILFERDSPDASRPDLAFISTERHLPVVGIVLVEPYEPEYPDRDQQPIARAAVNELMETCTAARVHIDTRLDANATGLRTAAEVESLIARMDAVVTTRLHGLVLGLKNGVPALAIDPVAGGAKIKRQAASVGWPAAITVDRLEIGQLSRALDFCLSSKGREMAARCAQKARSRLEELQEEFNAAMRINVSPSHQPKSS